MQTYSQMNKKLVGLLRLSDGAIDAVVSEKAEPATIAVYVDGGCVCQVAGTHSEVVVIVVDRDNEKVSDEAGAGISVWTDLNPAPEELLLQVRQQRQGVPERQPERTRPATADIAQAVGLLADALNMERVQAMPEIVAAFKKTHSTLLNQLAGAVLEAVASRPEEDLRIHPGLLKMAKELHKRVRGHFL